MIWDEQSLPKSLVDILATITENVYSTITDTPPTHANVTQWCKQPACWAKVKNMSLRINIPASLLLNKEEQHYIKQEEKKEKQLIHGIEMQSFAVQTPQESWQKLFGYYDDLKKEKNLNITENHFDLLRKMADGRIIVPTEKQAKVLYTLYYEAKNDAFVI